MTGPPSQVYDFIRDFTNKPMSTKEAVLGCAAKDALDVMAGMIIVVTTKGAPSELRHVSNPGFSVQSRLQTRPHTLLPILPSPAQGAQLVSPVHAAFMGQSASSKSVN